MTLQENGRNIFGGKNDDFAGGVGVEGDDKIYIIFKGMKKITEKQGNFSC